MKLTPLSLKDAEDFFICYNINDRKHGLPYAKNLEEAKKIIKKELSDKNSYKFSIWRRKNFVGMIVLEHPNKDKSSYEIGYAIGKNYWNKGLATKAVKKLTRYAFKELEIKKIWAGTAITNPASGRVLEKAGFKKIKENKREHIWEKRVEMNLGKYIIPFNKRPIKIGQGFNQGSHKDWVEDSEDMTYSIDFLLPVGTELIASKGGQVTKVKADGKKNYSGKNLVRGEEAYKNHMNEIEIKHSDGTYASYSHLKNKGVFVKIGDKVKQGQVIGLSGNTGWSSKPHLDFNVFKKNYKGRKIKTIKFKFKDYSGKL